MIDPNSSQPITLNGACHCRAVRFNVACLEGVSPFDFHELVVYDGSRHPADNAEHKTYVAGVLRFEPSPDA